MSTTHNSAAEPLGYRFRVPIESDNPAWRGTVSEWKVAATHPADAVDITPLHAALQSPAVQPVAALTYAQNLAKAIFESAYKDEPHYASGQVVWQCGDDLLTVLTQIDNMVSGMVRLFPPPAAPTEQAAPQAEAKTYAGYLAAIVETWDDMCLKDGKDWRPALASVIERRMWCAPAEQAAPKAEPVAEANEIVNAAIEWYGSSHKDEPEHRLAMAVLRFKTAAALNAQGESNG